MLPFIAAYNASNLYGFNAIDDQFVGKINFSAADKTDSNVIVNEWYEYFIKCSPEVEKRFLDRHMEWRLSKQTIQRTKAILEHISAQTTGTLPSSNDTISFPKDTRSISHELLSQLDLSHENRKHLSP